MYECMYNQYSWGGGGGDDDDDNNNDNNNKSLTKNVPVTLK